MTTTKEKKHFVVSVVYDKRGFDGRINGNTFNVRASDPSEAEALVRAVWHPMDIESVSAKELLALYS